MSVQPYPRGDIRKRARELVIFHDVVEDIDSRGQIELAIPQYTASASVLLDRSATRN